MTIKGLTEKLEKLKGDVGPIIVAIMVRNERFFLILNKQQLLAGKTRLGKDLSPTYLEDPYFETIAEAQAYSDWKDKITPNPKRRSGVPNLFINGYYHSSRQITILVDRVLYYSDDVSLERELEQKYGEEINGLGFEYKEAFIRMYARPDLHEKITEAIGLKFS